VLWYKGRKAVWGWGEKIGTIPGLFGVNRGDCKGDTGRSLRGIPEVLVYCLVGKYIYWGDGDGTEETSRGKLEEEVEGEVEEGSD
jgi:hypothetical protein